MLINQCKMGMIYRILNQKRSRLYNRTTNVPGRLLSYAIRHERTGTSSSAACLLLVLLGLVAVTLFSFSLGHYPISLSDLFLLWNTENMTAVEKTIIYGVRMPRIFSALLIGGTLSIAGATYQGLFKNPMVSPDILGASSGAGFGAAIAILLSLGPIGIQLTSFVFGLVAVMLTFVFSKFIAKGNSMTLILVLIGLVIGTLFSSFISITKYVADPDGELPEITFWLMGGLAAVSNRDIVSLLVLAIIGGVPLFMIRWKLNILSFGDEEAMSLGINVQRLRVILIACSTLLTASCVSICGLVGWIGLVVPHISRLIVGPDFKLLLPASALIGATFLLLVDDVARCAFSFEVPLGILTSLIGAPFFLYLLIKRNRNRL